MLEKPGLITGLFFWSKYNMTRHLRRRKTDFIQDRWRPWMAVLYSAVCAADFILFPVLWSLTQALLGMPLEQWQPLTLQSGGFFHIAMGAVLGIAAYGRTKEKLFLNQSEQQNTQKNTQNTQNDDP